VSINSNKTSIKWFGNKYNSEAKMSMKEISRTKEKRAIARGDLVISTERKLIYKKLSIREIVIAKIVVSIGVNYKSK
jgi:hypothetical protein